MYKVPKNRSAIRLWCVHTKRVRGLGWAYKGNKADRHKSRAPSLQRQTDRPTHRPTDRRTERLVESRARD